MTMIPRAVESYLREQGWGTVERTESVGGGCIANARRLVLASGTSVFLKSTTSTPPDMFPAEAEGLRALNVDGAPRVPAVLLADAQCIVLEDLPEGPRSATYWETFGRQLAALHDHHGPHFGFTCDTYCGATPQPNPATDDGHAFFGQHRLGYQVQLAARQGLLTASDRQLVERVIARLPTLVPAQPPSLIHGDLWSGNAHTTPVGDPALIDPAAHWGWAEAELGMTRMFGGFPARFYDAYVEARPLAPDWESRLDLYNLYHYLNHVNLFGTSYLSGVRSIAKRFA